MPTNPTGTGRRFCPSCGTESQSKWQFCAGCGQPLPRFDELHRGRRAHPSAKPGDLIASLIEEPQQASDPLPRRRDPASEPTQAEEAPAPASPKADGRSPTPPEPTQAEETASPTADLAPTPPAARSISVFDVRAPAKISGSLHDDEPIELDGPIEGHAAEDEPRQGRVTSYVQFVAIVAAALAVTVVGGLIVLNRRLSSFAVTGDADAVNDADRLVENIFQPMFFAAVAVLLVGLVWWTVRRRDELHQLGIDDSRFSDGMAAAAWVIPGINLVVPVMVLDELWRGGRAVRSGENWNDEPSNPWLWAWSALMALGLIAAISAAVASPTTIEATIDANTWSGIGYALIGLSLLTLVLTMSAVATTLRFTVRRSKPRELVKTP